jgi:hypothetical protein
VFIPVLLLLFLILFFLRRASVKMSTQLERPSFYPDNLMEPVIHRSEDGSLEHSVNDPLVYAREFDTYASVPALEHVIETAMNTQIEMGRAWAAHDTANPQGAVMVTFDSFQDLRAHTPTRNKRGATHVWMPAAKLFSWFASHFAWTLECYVPGKSVLVYLNVHETTRERTSYQGRVFVQQGHVRAAPVCVSRVSPRQLVGVAEMVFGVQVGAVLHGRASDQALQTRTQACVCRLCQAHRQVVEPVELQPTTAIRRGCRCSGRIRTRHGAFATDGPQRA